MFLIFTNMECFDLSHGKILFVFGPYKIYYLILVLLTKVHKKNRREHFIFLPKFLGVVIQKTKPF